MALETTLLHCTTCQGEGYVNNQICDVCHNQQSTLGFVESDLIYWKNLLSVQGVIERRAQQKADKLLNGIFFLIIVSGCCALVWEAVLTMLRGDLLLNVFFQPSLGVGWFWCTMISTMILVARVQIERQFPLAITPANLLVKFKPTGNIADWNYWKTVNPKYKINVADYYTTETRLALDVAYGIAQQHKHTAVLPIHWLLALALTPEFRTTLIRLEVNITELFLALDRVADYENSQLHVTTENIQYSAAIRELVLFAYTEARDQHLAHVNAAIVLKTIVAHDQRINDAFYDHGVDLEKLNQLVSWSKLVDDIVEREHRRRRLAQSKPKGTMNRSMTARPTKLLDAISQDFTMLAKNNAFLPPVGRDDEITQTFRILQERHTSVMLVGPAGVGKSTILQGIAQLMTAEDVPKTLQDKRLIVTDPGAIIAGASSPGDLELRMQMIIEDIMRARNIIWVIEDIHSLLGAGSTGSSIDIGKILMNYISQGYIQVIGTTTTQEYQKYVNVSETFARRFQVVQVPELSPEYTMTILEARAPYIEGRHKVWFTIDAIQACVALTDRFIKDRSLPAKAVDIMEESAVYAREQGSALVTKAMIQQVMAHKTNATIQALSDDQSSVLLHLEELLHRRIVGQDQALAAVAKALRRASQDIRDVTRPIASLLFLGPTGVGKTETAKALAEEYFGNEKTMIRFDMSEYGASDSAAKLIGSTNQQGQLTELIRQTPFGVLLFDEFEKAHPDVQNLLLQILEDGRLTDGLGRTADFTNAIVIATSNGATDTIQQLYHKGSNSEQIRNTILSGGDLQRVFRTELLNRFDDIVIFTPLTQDQLIQVAYFLLQELATQLKTKGITLQWTTATLMDLAQRGYDPVFGARPLRRLIQDTTQDAIAKLLLSKQLGRRDIVELQPKGEVKLIKAEQI